MSDEYLRALAERGERQRQAEAKAGQLLDAIVRRDRDEAARLWHRPPEVDESGTTKTDNDD